MSWQEEQMMKAKAELLTAETEMLKALKDVPTGYLKVRNQHPYRERFLWASLWFAQLLTWGFMMMTFKKDVWPR